MKDALVKNVAIVGAGLGGLTCAIALRQYGIHAQIYEQAKELKAIGAGLTLFPNGLNVLQHLDPQLLDTLKATGSSTQKLTLKKSNGEIIATQPILLSEKYGQPMLNIRWSRLQEILMSFLPSDIIHINHHCKEFSQDENNVTLHFAENKTTQCDLLIGADGLHSVIRQHLIQDSLPRYAGRLSWRGILPFEHTLLPPNEAILITATEGKNFLIVDIGEGYKFWSAGMLSSEARLSETAAETKERVLTEFGNWGQPVPEIIQETPATDIIEKPIGDRPPIKTWSQGRVTLLGDAAHPMVPSLGQGANTAFEDAYELAKCLSQAVSLEEALLNYENRRIERTQIIQARSAIQGQRAYDPDSENYLRGIAEKAHMARDEFDNWLYHYPV